MSIHFSVAAGAMALAACFSSSPAFAGVQSFVSVKGTDTGTCASPNAPCRTFAYAHNQTSAGGEILALDAGDYGPVTITKSLSITGAVPGAGVRGGPESGSAITIAGGATDVVDLTGLTLDGLNVSMRGITGSIAGMVTIKNCVIQNYSQRRGLTLGTGPVKYLVEDVFVTGVGSDGIFCQGSCVINRVSVNNAGASGIVAGSLLPVTVSEARISGSNNGTLGSIGLNRSVVTGNNTGVFLTVNSAGDNFVRGNGTNFSVTPNAVGKQ